jgi:hypothetical protein
MPPVKMIWYDGGLMPARPELIEDGRMMGDDGGGVLFVGKKGTILCGTYGENPRLLPEKMMQDYKRPAKTIPRSPGIHEEWIAAIKAGQKSTPLFLFRTAHGRDDAPGNIAIRSRSRRSSSVGPGQDAQFPNFPTPTSTCTSSTGRG